MVVSGGVGSLAEGLARALELGDSSFGNSVLGTSGVERLGRLELRLLLLLLRRLRPMGACCAVAAPDGSVLCGGGRMRSAGSRQRLLGARAT